jgi:hypothetical protein
MTVHFTQQILAWGKVVKSWATDLDYVNAEFTAHPPAKRIAADARWKLPTMAPAPVSAGDPVEIPAAVSLTAAQFVDTLKAAGISDTILPDAVKHVVLVQGNETTMVVRMPPREYLQQSENDLRTDTYAIPEFYNKLFTQPDAPEVHPLMPITYPDIMKLHSNRVGEYTLNNCT